jgi:acetylornithine/N-succinyldiaminopimelate aminotransferase
LAGISKKEQLLYSLLQHREIKSVKGKGLLFAVEFSDFTFNKKVIDACIRKGVITDWFLFSDKSLRIAPPLIINEEQIRTSVEVILASIEESL